MDKSRVSCFLTHGVHTLLALSCLSFGFCILPTDYKWLITHWDAHSISVGCWYVDDDLTGALHSPPPIILSCSKLHNGGILVPGYLGWPRKWPLNECCIVYLLTEWCTVRSYTVVWIYVCMSAITERNYKRSAEYQLPRSRGDVHEAPTKCLYRLFTTTRKPQTRLSHYCELPSRLAWNIAPMWRPNSSVKRPANSGHSASLSLSCCL